MQAEVLDYLTSKFSSGRMGISIVAAFCAAWVSCESGFREGSIHSALFILSCSSQARETCL